MVLQGLVAVLVALMSPGRLLCNERLMGGFYWLPEGSVASAKTIRAGAGTGRPAKWTAVNMKLTKETQFQIAHTHTHDDRYKTYPTYYSTYYNIFTC